jgi:hypothetical protein
MGQEDPSFYPPQQTSAGDRGLADSYGGQGILVGAANKTNRPVK